MIDFTPDISIRLTTWTSEAQTRLLVRVCRKWEVAPADVVRTALEVMGPLIAEQGPAAYLSEHEIEELQSPVAKKRPEQFPEKITGRFSERTRDAITAGRTTRRRGRKLYSQAEILRYSYQAGFTLALTRGLSHLMKLREQAILARTPKKR